MMEASNHTDELPYESHDLSFSRLVLMLVLVLGVLSGVPFRSVWGGIVSGIARVALRGISPSPGPLYIALHLPLNSRY